MYFNNAEDEKLALISIEKEKSYMHFSLSFWQSFIFKSWIKDGLCLVSNIYLYVPPLPVYMAWVNYSSFKENPILKFVKRNI